MENVFKQQILKEGACSPGGVEERYLCLEKNDTNERTCGTVYMVTTKTRSVPFLVG